MANEIQICNFALSNIGAARIQSLNDPTKEARECKIHYPIARDAVLEDYDWDFARKRLSLAKSSDEYSGWDFAYQWPVDCVAVRKIQDVTGAYSGTYLDSDTGVYVSSGNGVEYEIAANASLDRRVVLTDMDDAELVYTARVTDANMFSPLYVVALGFRLASALAIPIKGKAALATSMMNTYLFQLGRAQASQANQQNKKPSDDSSFTRVRA
jgi:hypothetical protein